MRYFFILNDRKRHGRKTLYHWKEPDAFFSGASLKTMSLFNENLCNLWFHAAVAAGKAFDSESRRVFIFIIVEFCSPDTGSIINGETSTDPEALET
jgi:hypothetical protein